MCIILSREAVTSSPLTYWEDCLELLRVIRARRIWGTFRSCTGFFREKWHYCFSFAVHLPLATGMDGCSLGISWRCRGFWPASGECSILGYSSPFPSEFQMLRATGLANPSPTQILCRFSMLYTVCPGNSVEDTGPCCSRWGGNIGCTCTGLHYSTRTPPLFRTVSTSPALKWWHFTAK